MIYQATEIFRRNESKELTFIPYPLTWLRGERWETVTKKENNTNLNRLAG